MRYMEAFHKGNSQREFHQRFQSQSAMEYLMTYGWAILIIAVVLAALFELGVFNPMTFAPKASPGSCQVVRPDGPGTIDFISLSGECNGELPQYVAQFNGNGYITANIPNIPTGVQPRTFTAWVYSTNPSQNNGFIGYGSSTKITGYAFYAAIGTACGGPGNIWVDTYYTCLNLPPQPLSSSWVFVAYTYNGVAEIGYSGYNRGRLYNISESFTANTQFSPFYMGTFSNWEGGPFIGELSNVQLYNTALSANDIQALYQEGIGGAPINLQSLVGWWPLNGNANDYSGNGNNGVASGVTYTSNWYSGYSAP